MYEFIVECTVEKICTVTAKNEEQAIEKMNQWEVYYEQDIDIKDWEIISGPKEVS